MRHGDRQKIAKKSAVTLSYVCLILGGHRRPSYSAAKRLASATGTDPFIWLEGSPEEIRAAIEEAEAKAEQGRVAEMRVATEALTEEAF